MKRFDLVGGKLVEAEDGAYVQYDGGGQWMDVSDTGIKRPEYLPKHNSRLIADYIQDWLTSNKVTDVRKIYHNPFPIGFVQTWIDRAERAEQRVRELERT